MGREKRRASNPAGAGRAKERQRRTRRAHFDSLASVPEGLVARPAVPKSRHRIYLEFVENKDKKKKLEYEITPRKSPPPGFEFVPIGNPELTSACKELSREKDAMIFIVSSVATNGLSQQVNRLGHHFRHTIVEEARESTISFPRSGAITPDGKPQPIPESQAEYHAHADAALRDLFPRIPNTDRQMIVEHSFTRRANGRGEPVGFSDDIPLARRVQLAVLAHIRHNHTRYDELLREAGWQAARKAVEALCLDIIVKWRGDEETGRDQLDEILREVVVISDTDGEGSDVDSSDESSADESGSSASVAIPQHPLPLRGPVGRDSPPASTAGSLGAFTTAQGNSPSMSAPYDARDQRKNQRGFKRYQAWQDAIMRNRESGASMTGIPSNVDGGIDVRHPQAHTGFLDRRQQPLDPTVGSKPDWSGRGNGSVVSTDSIAPSRLRSVGTALPLSRHTVGTQPSGSQPQFFALNHQESVAPSSPGMNIPTSHRFRDILVPSIEPVSPDVMKPAFVRAVPPRRQFAVDRSSPRAPAPFPHDEGLLPSANFETRSNHEPGRRVINDHMSQPSRPSSFTDTGPVFISQNGDDAPRFQNSPGQFGTRQPRILQHESQVYDNVPRAERIVVNASRPGTRANPILMEDRGGFYERIPVMEQPTYPVLGHVDASVAPQEPYTATQSYRVVHSRDQANRSGHNLASASEIFNPRWRPVSVQAAEYSDGRQREYRGHPTFIKPEPSRSPRRARFSEPRLTSDRHPAPRQSVPAMARYPPEEVPLDRTALNVHGKRPAEDGQSHDGARRYRNRSLQPENVIVLD